MHKKICEEILHCHCYYYDMGEKGEQTTSITPKLSTRWKNDGSVGNNIFVSMYKKMQFIGGSLKSFNYVGEVDDCLDKKHVATHMENSAEQLKLFKELLVSNKNSGTENKMEEVASKLRNLEPLKGSMYYNAVQQAHASLRSR